MSKVSSPRLAIERLPISVIAADPRNPRQHSDRQIKLIAQSITSFGFNVPVLIGPENRIAAGHGRVLAAKRLGLSEVPISLAIWRRCAGLA